MANTVQSGGGKWFGSIRSKIIAVVILSILPLNILVLASTAGAINVVQAQALHSMENIAALYAQQLDNRVAAINHYFFELENNDADFLRLSQQRGDDAYHMAQTNLAARFLMNIKTAGNAEGYFYYAGGVDDVTLVLPDPLAGETAAQLREVRAGLMQWMRNGALPGLKRWNVVTAGERDWLLSVYNNQGFYYGALISLDNVAAGIRRAVDFKGLQVHVGAPRPLSAQDPAQLAAAAASARTGLALSLSVPKQEIIRTLPVTQWLSILLAVAYLLLIPLLILWLNRVLLRPLNQIRAALLHLKSGDRDYRIGEQNSAEEFRSLNRSFNEMADNIEALKIQNYEKKAAQQKMELRNLQLQIRPHFLLNMFKLVHSLAQLQEYESIQKLALYLSNYFRYLFRSGKDLEPFEREQSLIDEYLEISAIRYPGGFTVHTSVDEAVKKVRVPPLLLHNFVENIINHALRPGTCIRIDLRARHTGGWAEFSIRDSGAGMAQAVCDSINSGTFADTKGDGVHIGISNSLQRIRYFYGEQSTLRVESAVGEGTHFVIRFPYGVAEEGGA